MGQLKIMRRKLTAIIMTIALLAALIACLTTTEIFSNKVKAGDVVSTSQLIDEDLMHRKIVDYDNPATDFDFKPYVIKHFANSDIQNLISFRTDNGVASKGLVEYLDNNPAFQASYAVWYGSDFITNALDASIDMVYSPHVYYETVLLHSLIDYCSNDNVIEAINKSNLKTYGKLTKSLYGAVKNESEYSHAGALLKANKKISSLTEEEKASLTQWMTNSVNQETEAILGTVVTADNAEVLDKLITTSSDMKTCIDKLSTYISLMEVYSELAAYIQSLIESVNTLTDDDISVVEKVYLLTALNEVKSICESSTNGFLTYLVANSTVVGSKSFIKDAISNKWKNWLKNTLNAEYLSGGEAAVNMGLLAITLTKTISNLGFSTDAKCENYDLMKRVVLLEKAEARTLTKYLNNPETNQALEILDGVNILYKTYSYDLELYEKMISLSQKDWIHLGASEQELSDEKNNIRKYREIIADELKRLNVEHGKLSETTAWCLTDDGHLCLYGHGIVPDFQQGEAPWYELKDSIKAVDISADITSLGDYALYGLNSIENDIIFENPITTYENCFDGLNTTNTLVFGDNPRFLRTNNIPCSIYCDQALNVGTGASGWLTDIVFESPVYVRGNADITAGGISKNSLVVKGNLVIYNACRADSTFTIGKASKAYIGGNLTVTVQNLWDAKNTLLVDENADLKVNGNLSFNDKDRKTVTFINKGNVTVETNFVFCNGIVAPRLVFESTPNSHLTVKGDIDTNYVFNFTEGTLELHGLSKHNWYGGWSFGGNAKLIFSGSTSYDSIACNGGTVIITGTTKPTFYCSGNVDTIIVECPEGVTLRGGATINRLFNHNGYPRAYSSAMTFPDYDGDGLKDNVDPHPLVPENEVVSSIRLSKESITIKEDDTETVEVSLLNENGEKVDRQIAWKTSDDSVCSVNKDGVIVGVNEGEATVTVEIDEQKESIQVTVLPDDLVATVEVSPTSLSIPVGKTEYIKAQTYNKRGKKLNKTPIYSVDDSAVCTVDESGLLKAKKRGTTEVNIECEGVNTSIVVNVTEAVHTVVTIKSPLSSLSVPRLRTASIPIELFNEDGIKIVKDINWKSGNPWIATVNKEGKIRGIMLGKTTVTATVDGQTLSIPVTVTPYETVGYRAIKTIITNVAHYIFGR